MRAGKCCTLDSISLALLVIYCGYVKCSFALFNGFKTKKKGQSQLRKPPSVQKKVEGWYMRTNPLDKYFQRKSIKVWSAELSRDADSQKYCVVFYLSFHVFPVVSRMNLVPVYSFFFFQNMVIHYL